MGAEEVYLLCHHWISDEELFLGVDVGRIAAGIERPEDAYRPGALLRAVEASQKGPVVLVVDELDKAPQRAEALLLEFLQTGLVHGPRGERWAARPENLVVFLTTNGLRPLMEPTLRRGLRVRMQFLPTEVEAQILRRLTGARQGACNVVVRAMNAIRAHGESSPSLQEAAHLLEDMKTCASAVEVAVLVQGWLVKGDEDIAALDKLFARKGGEGVAALAAALWGEARR
jgi:MoxR-like ATPase